MGYKYKRRKGKKTINSNKINYDGIKFASGLERYCYIALKKHKIFGGYEDETYQLIEGFEFLDESYERQSNGKGEFTQRGKKKILGIKYTPDFTGEDYIIECKGRANESFPLRWKLFKSWIAQHSPGIALFKPQNQKDCDETIRQIEIMRKNLRTNAKKKQTSL